MKANRSITDLRPKANSLLRALILIASTLFSINATARAQTEPMEGHAETSSPIDGTWIFSIDRVDHSLHFTAISSFAAGGVFLATGSGDRINPVSPLHGSWKRTGPNRYDSTTYFYAFDPAGYAVAMIKTNQVFHLNGRDELEGSGVGFSCDLQGENCIGIPATAIKLTAKRVLVERLHEDGLPPE